MELTVHSLRGRVTLSGLSEATSIRQLKDLLHEQHHGGKLAVPAPDKQRLVFNNQVLQDSDQLSGTGMSNGDDVVLLVPRELPPLPQPDPSPTPDAASIRAAITAEALARGISEEQLAAADAADASAASSRARRVAALGLPPQLLGSFDGRLLDLLDQALGGRLGGPMFQPMPAPLGARGAGRGGGGARGNAAAALQQAQRRARADAAGLHEGGAGEEEDEEEGEGEPEADIVPPEPSAANVAALVEMGFAEAVARKALVLTRDNVSAALDWVLTNPDDDATQPPTQEQLRQLYRRPRARRRVGGGVGRGAGAGAALAAPAADAPVPLEALAQLTDMGFEAEAARRALLRFGNNVEVALHYLLAAGDAGGAPAGGGGGGGAAAAPAAAAGAAAAAPGAGAGPEAAAPHQGAAASGPPSLDESEGGMHDDGYTDEDEDEERYGSDMEGEGYEEGDEDEGEEGDAMDADGAYLDDALAGGVGTMALAELGSADMEQLLHGVPIEELYSGAAGSGAAGFPLAPVDVQDAGPAARELVEQMMESPQFMELYARARAVLEAVAGAAAQRGGAEGPQPPPQQQQEQQPGGQQQQQQQQQP